VYETQAQVVLLVRAFEETDRDGHVLSEHVRATASRRALRVTGLSDWSGERGSDTTERYTETVIRRTRLLFEVLLRKIPALRGMLKVAQLGVGTAPTVLLTGLIVGLATNVLGPSQRINLLALPLMGILAWNVAIYASAIFVKPILPQRLAGIFLKSALWRRLHGWSLSHAVALERRAVTAKALLRFAASWHRVAGPLLAARVRRTLHLGAMAVATGAVGGMYLRGLGLAYRATWESTWLSTAAVQGFLGVLLGPAALIIGEPVPDIGALRGPGASGDAAIWIHLYAMTTVLYVIVPRFALAIYQSWRCEQLSNIPIDLHDDLHDGYFRHVFTEWRGATRSIEIVPYSFTPEAATLGRVKALFHDYFGARADVRTTEPLEYGDTPTKIASVPSLGPWSRQAMTTEQIVAVEREYVYVVLFNLAQSPEAEVHAAFLDDLKRRIEGAGHRLIVLVDVTAYRRSVGDAERLDERLRSWNQVTREAHLTSIGFDPTRDDDTAALGAVRAAIWPPVEAVEATE